MNQADNVKRRRWSLTVLLGASLLAGCQPEGTGSIAVNRGDPTVRSFKSFEDVKQPKAAKGGRKPAAQRNPVNSNFR